MLLSAQIAHAGPLTPAQAIDAFQLADDRLLVELVVSEPQIEDPVAITFDAAGRLYVVEMRGFQQGPDAKGLPGLGRVTRFEDRDRDGRYDHSTVFADDMYYATAITAAYDGIVVGCAPDILFFKDTDGDGRADVRKVVYTGFGRSNHEQLINSFQWGIDNWIHAANGGSGGQIRPANQPDAEPIHLGTRNFRFRITPEGDPAGFEITSGGAQWGLTTDDFDRWFTAQNPRHNIQIMLPERYLQQNPYLAVQRTLVDIPDHGAACRVFRISPLEEWRVVRTRQRAATMADRYPPNELEPGGYITSGCGIHIYGGTLLPEEYRGQSFTCEPANNLIHRDRLDGPGPQLKAVRIDQEREFLASTDGWFRPVTTMTGPDGGLYVVDMYREIIETPVSIPPEILKTINMDNGKDMGRIYRVRARDSSPPPVTDLAAASSIELVDYLTHPNIWLRLTAQRLLYERRDAAAVSALRQLAALEGSPGRLHALYTLADLGELTIDQVIDALRAADARVRKAALRLAEPHLTGAALRPPASRTKANHPQAHHAQSNRTQAHHARENPTHHSVAAAPRGGRSGAGPAPRGGRGEAGPAPGGRSEGLATVVPVNGVDQRLFDALMALQDDPSPEVRFQLALSLSVSDSERAIDCLLGLARRDLNDAWIRTAILLGLNDRAAAFWQRLSGADTLLKQPSSGMRAFARDLAAIVGARQRSDEWLALLEPAASQKSGDGSLIQSLLEGLRIGVERAGGHARLSGSAREQAAICEVLLALFEAPAATRMAAWRLGGKIRWLPSAAYDAALDSALATAASDQAPLAQRNAALEFVSAGPIDRVAPRLLDLLTPEQPAELQKFVITALAASGQASVAADLLEADRWFAYTPAVRDTVVAAMLARSEYVPALLAGIREGYIPAWVIAPTQRERLLASKDAKIRAAAQEVLAPTSAGERQEVFDRYLPALSGPASVDRGREVFRANCAACHVLEGVGSAVGPDLAGVRDRPPDQLLSDILMPSRTVTAGFAAYMIETHDGEALTGVIASETATAITLRQKEGVETTILRSQIRSIYASALSMMPEDLEQTITPQQMADLIAYLKAAR